MAYSLNQIIAVIKQIGQTHRLIRTVREDLPENWLHNEDKDVVYPAMFFEVTNSTSAQGERTYTFTFVIVDKSHEEDVNRVEQLSDCDQIANDVIAQMNFGLQMWEMDKNISFEYLSYALEDVASGVTFSVNLTVPFNFDACDLPSTYDLPNGSFVYINTNRFMTVYDFIVGAGQPLTDGGTTLTNNQFVVPPFVFIGGSLVGYTVTTDRRYISHNATTKTITINNGGVLNDEHVFIVI
jgi:hypothetical protein